MTDKLTVAVLGTGIMGAAMARNLVKAGHAVRAWNRSLAKAEPLAGDGAQVTATAAEAVADADVIVTMLYDGATALDVMNQAVPGLKASASWVQATTSGLDQIEELAAFAAAHDLAFFDAPVLGTKAPAEAGQLTVLAAGPRNDAVERVFDAVGGKTVWLGEDGATGAATRLKLVANSWTLALTHAAAEALSLAEALGADFDKFLEAIAGGPLDAGYLRVKTGAIRNEQLNPASFAVGTAAKDANLIVEAGRAHGVRLDVAAAGAERFRRAAAKGHGDADMAASYYASFED